ncbi:MAG: leucine-rich repeat domain-containing protein [Clostridia bacterium]|nr:leucine-rich repeat domain-containing protein [Clostridia bacterium]
MKKNIFPDAMTHLDGDLIEKYYVIDEEITVQTSKSARGRWLKWVAVAACFAVLCATCIVVPNVLKQPTADFEIEDGVLLSYHGDDAEVVVPRSVTRIANYAFKNKKNIKTIVLTSNVKSVDHYAFYGCENLNTLTLTEDHPYFKNTGGLILSMDGTTLIYANRAVGENLEVPESVTEIQSCAICYSDIRVLTLPESITSLGEYGIIFNDCLESVVLSGVTEIGQNAFYNNVSLKAVSAPKAITIGKNAFSGCVSLRTVSCPAAQVIEKEAFSNCVSLEDIELPAAIRIADGAFYRCKELLVAQFPLVEEIGNHTFSESGLAVLKCPKVTSLGKSFLNDTKVASLTIPQVTSGLSPDTFNGSALRELRGHSGSYVERYAIENGFSFIDLEAITYPNGYVETNDIVYVLGAGTALMKDESGTVVDFIPPFSATKEPLQRYAKGAEYSIVGYYGEQYYAKNESLTDVRPAVDGDETTDYGDFEYVEHDTYIEITHYRGAAVHIVVPEQINGKPVQKLARTFLDGVSSDTSMMRKVVKSITAKSVTTLEEGMGFWRELYSLEVLIMPKVEKVWDDQFQDATKLKYIDLSSASYIGDYAFNSMKNCGMLILGEIEEISKDAFAGATVAVVKGKANTYAEQWANAKNIRFETVAE